MKSNKQLFKYVYKNNPIKHLFIVLNAPVEEEQRQLEAVSLENARTVKFQFT